MSTEEQDAIVGRLVRQQADSIKELALLRAELNRISQDFKSLSTSLTMMDYLDGFTERTAEDVLKHIDVEKTLALISKARRAASLRDSASESLRQLGMAPNG